MGVPHPSSDIWSSVSAVLFDLDGVITPTAEVHQRAWLEALSEFGATVDDYHMFLDGRSRIDGIRGFLLGHCIELPEGDSSDEPSNSSIHGIAARKNALFLDLLEQEPFSPYSGSVNVLDFLDSQHTPFALVTSSRNAEAVLRSSGLTERFEIIVDGNRAQREGLLGKPSADTYVRGADLLGLPPRQCAVVEDAVSGVTAGRNGGFGFVLGVDRGAGVEALTEAGADAVVRDLQETLP